MRNKYLVSAALIGASIGGVALAQVGRGGSEWLAGGGDAQRTSWIRTDAKISLETMSKPGFELQWTTNPGNRARGLNGLTQGVSANGVTLFVPMTVVAGSSNNVYGIDNDTGYIVWSRKFDATLPAVTAGCPGGITAAPARIVNLTPGGPAAGPAFGGGRGGGQGYRSLLGEPGEGVPVEARGGGPGRAAGAPAAPPAAGAPPAGAPPAGAPPAAAPPAGAPPAAGAGAGRAAGAPPAGAPGGGGGGGRGGPQPSGIPGAPPVTGGGLSRPSGVAYAISSDGMLHVVGLPSGKDVQKPAPFLPPNAKWSDAVAVNTTMYAATAAGCGNAPSGVWAIDLESPAKPVTSWKTNGGSIVGRVALTSDGTLIVAIGPGQVTGDGKANAIVALDGKTLQVKDWYSEPATEFVTGPTILRHANRDLVAAATKDGRVVLLDGASLGGATHATALAKSDPLVAAGGSIAGDAIAAWQESIPGLPAAAAAPGGAPAPVGPALPGSSWILVPVSGRIAATAPTNGAITAGAVVALKLGAAPIPAFQVGWTSANLATPATPVIVNGVVFALSTGRPATATGQGTAAVLHAYDAVTGKALWNSQKAMTSFASPGSFWSAFGQAYVGTHDGKLHAFGFLDERR